ncbi:hypothetical protein DFJ58DRAFT_839166 [Suillus subalutaceus]|uniref:uncharacterized protein n=1 Tax=Suillus subalutaceus TaxID=48586 RepID=UPI001B86EC7D|nr:uncharacterized protein DFJ58DRAFT_839166 [Suillus subalutaceus]KAG1863182.1 hypothetical protein DFJ58DRAFT_839166 [Suillus subalutaceus]
MFTDSMKMNSSNLTPSQMSKMSTRTSGGLEEFMWAMKISDISFDSVTYTKKTIEKSVTFKINNQSPLRSTTPMSTIDPADSIQSSGTPSQEKEREKGWDEMDEEEEEMKKLEGRKDGARDEDRPSPYPPAHTVSIAPFNPTPARPQRPATSSIRPSDTSHRDHYVTQAHSHPHHAILVAHAPNATDTSITNGQTTICSPSSTPPAHSIIREHPMALESGRKEVEERNERKRRRGQEERKKRTRENCRARNVSPRPTTHPNAMPPSLDHYQQHAQITAGIFLFFSNKHPKKY